MTYTYLALLCFNVPWVVFIVDLPFINCFDVPKRDMFATQHRYSDSVQMVDLVPPKPGWIDPFAVLGDSPTQNNLLVQSDVDIYVLNNRLKKCEIFMRRFINLFLRSITRTSMEKSAEWVEFVKLEFSISKQEFNILEKFGERGECDKDIELVSDLLSKILSQSSNREKSYYGLDSFLRGIQNILSKFVNSPEWTVLISISVLFLTTAWLIYNHFYLAAFLTFSTTIFFCGFGFTWIRMYEEKELEKYVNHVMHSDVPHHCKGEHMEWYEHMYYRMFGTDCLEFYKVRDVRSIVKVSPTDVLVETISSMIIIPLKHLGEAYGNFMSNFTRAVPFWLAPFAMIFSAAVPLLFVLLLLTFVFKYRFSISWTGFYFAPVLFQSREPVQAQTSTKYIEDLPPKNYTQLQSNTSCEPEMSENNKPMFVVMNMSGLKKFVSKTEMSSGQNKETVKVAPIEDGESDKKESEENSSNDEEAGETKQMDDMVVSLQVKRSPDQCKRRSRSILTVTDGSSLNRDTGTSFEENDKVNSDSVDESFLNSIHEKTELKDKTT